MLRRRILRRAILERGSSRKTLTIMVAERLHTVCTSHWVSVGVAASPWQCLSSRDVDLFVSTF